MHGPTPFDLPIDGMACAKSRQNLLRAVAYNLMNFPLAAFGPFIPLQAFTTRGLPCVSAVSNALLLQSCKPKDLEDQRP